MQFVNNAKAYDNAHCCSSACKGLANTAEQRHNARWSKGNQISGVCKFSQNCQCTLVARCVLQGFGISAMGSLVDRPTQHTRTKGIAGQMTMHRHKGGQRNFWTGLQMQPIPHQCNNGISTIDDHPTKHPRNSSSMFTHTHTGHKCNQSHSSATPVQQ